MLSEKIVIVVMIVFLFGGVYAYDQYVTSQGQVSPVGQLIDFAGLSKYVPWEEYSSVQTKSIYYENVQENLNRIDKIHYEIQAQRNKLVENRRNILNELISLEGTITAEAVGYAELISDERDKAVELFATVEGAVNDLIDTQFIEDAQSQSDQIEEIKENLRVSFNEIYIDPERDLAHGEEVFENINTMIIEKNVQEVFGCVTLDECLQEQGDLLGEDLSEYVDTKINQPEGQLEELNILSGILIEDYKRIADEVVMDEAKFDEADEKIESLYKTTVEDLMNSTEEDLKKLRQLYKELEKEKEKLLESMQMSQNRIYTQHREMYLKMHEITNRLRELTNMNFQSLFDAIEFSDAKGKKLLEESQSIDYEMGRLVEKNRSENEKFIDDTTESINAFRASELNEEVTDSLQKSYRDTIDENRRRLQDMRIKSREQRI